MSQPDGVFAEEQEIPDDSPVYASVGSLRNRDISSPCDDGESCCSSARSILTVAASQTPALPTDEACSNLSKVAQTQESSWTNDMHNAFLSYMEASFVKSLYNQEYCAVDLCGQDPHSKMAEEADSAQSHLQFPSTCLKFKSYRHGDWKRRIVLKPSITPGLRYELLASPWVKHFRHSSLTVSNANTKVSKEVASPENGLIHKLSVAVRDVQPTEDILESHGTCAINQNSIPNNKRIFQDDLDHGDVEGDKVTKAS